MILIFNIDGLILSLYALILDYAFGCILFVVFTKTASVKKVLKELEGTRHLERYSQKVYMAFSIWTSLLLSLVILVLVEKFTPAVYQTVHIASIMNSLNQLINTLQFFFAFEFIRSVEFLVKLGSGRKRINSFQAISSNPSNPNEEMSSGFDNFDSESGNSGEVFSRKDLDQ